MTLSKLMLPLVLFVLLAHGTGRGQTAGPSFEVATIKPASATDGHTHINYPPGDSWSAINITLSALMQWAYGMPETQILDGPAWLKSTRFDIQAKLDMGSPEKPVRADADAKRKMVQTLLAERFNLKVHDETRMLPAYDLVVAKGGPKLEVSKANGKSIGAGRTHLDLKGLEMPLIVEQISLVAGRVVVDKTGLTDRYDVKLVWAADDAPAGENSAPSLFTAIQEQLGLKLEPAKEPVPVLVIDHIDLPTPN
jgi:uncharacterized protein (TIGR03435 family)